MEYIKFDPFTQYLSVFNYIAFVYSKYPIDKIDTFNAVLYHLLL